MGGTKRTPVSAAPAAPGVPTLDSILRAAIVAAGDPAEMIFADLSGDGDLDRVAKLMIDGVTPVAQAALIAHQAAAEAGGLGLAFGVSLTGLDISDPSGGFLIGADDPVLVCAALQQSSRDDGVITTWAEAPFPRDDQAEQVEGGFAGLSEGAGPERPGGDSPGTAGAEPAGQERGTTTALAPTDPLYGFTVFEEQWHLSRLGNIERVWDEFTGAGVKVGVYDDGVQATHPDLNDNYDASNHVVIGGVTYGGAPVLENGKLQAHGTATAGLIAAEANGAGTVGVSFDAKITGINIFDPNSAIFINGTEQAPLAEALRQSSRFDIVNNSWGSDPFFDPEDNTRIEDSPADKREDAWADAAAVGRGGLGTVIVKSAGNEWGNAVADGLNGSRYTLTVAASGTITYTEADGFGIADFAAEFSNHGTPILVTAPGVWIVTTDLLGADGYNFVDPFGQLPDVVSDDTNYYGGTSASAPIVSGVVALMLDANPDLGWRDVHNIIGASATRTGSAFDAAAPSVTENGTWFVNAADGWNGGGMHAHTNYGYGMVDAYSAVRMAEVWTTFTPAQTSANEASATTGQIALGSAIPDLSTLTRTFSFSGALEIEHAELTLALTHAEYWRDLRIFLVSAEGTEVQLWDGAPTNLDGFDYHNGEPFPVDGWSFGIEHLRGEDPNGIWTIEIRDTWDNDVGGTLDWLELKIYGSVADTSDVLHFTDEYSDMAAFQPGRQTVSDTDGGEDWINAAAVSTASRFDLADGATSTVDGTGFTLVGDIEHAIGGDGGDTLDGNGLGNHLLGMRGNDALHGKGGADTLEGGAGDDALDGGPGSDTLIGGGGADQLSGNDGARDLASYAGSASGVIVDIGNGLPENDGDAQGDVLSGIEDLTGSGHADALTGDTGGNVLDGGAGNDTLAGGGGNDVYIVDNAGDRVIEANVLGADVVRSSVSFSLVGQFIESLTLTGAAAINATGNSLANLITGNGAANRLQGLDGADTLDGGLGADTMQGGAGDDSYVVDHAGDRVTELVGAGTDRVLASVGFSLAGLFVETLTLTGAAAINATGNSLANLITGNGAANRLQGLDGADTLDGGLSADTMNGGGGDDSYVVDSAADRVIEADSAGTDRVLSSVTFSLAGQQAENLTLVGAPPIDGSGNELANLIAGTGAANRLQGLDNADTLQGNDGADTLEGGIGDDSLDGGTGADSMLGGSGSDTYTVDAAGDRVLEANVAGIDLVRSAVGFSLVGQFIEGLALTGAAAINGTGNSLDNVLTGNGAANRLQGLDGADTLDGGAGADTMDGGTGDDSYVVDNAGDRVIEVNAADTDRVLSSVGFNLAGQLVENLTLTGAATINGSGNSLANALTGNDAANRLRGLGGADVLEGGGGADTLDGGTGADAFVFATALGNGNVDRIVEFSVADDTIHLAAGIFSGLPVVGLPPALASTAFVIGARATTLDHRVIYNSATGALLYDSDGTDPNASVHFATLSTGLLLTPADFMVT